MFRALSVLLRRNVTPRRVSFLRHRVNRGLATQGTYDVVIVGGGIIGLATARELSLRQPMLKLALVEKEKELSVHQSGKNSGVIHCGIYYTPGSLKAKLCVEGLELAYKYCNEKNIPYKRCGKIIVAVEERELPQLEKLYQRGLENGVKDLKILNSEEIKEVEPYCKGLSAILSPNTGIVDWAEVAKSYGADFKEAGGDIYTGFEVTDFTCSPESDISQEKESGHTYPVTVHGKNVTLFINGRYVVTCGGLYSDRLAEKSGCSKDPRIVPFRGEYLKLKEDKSYLVNGNIYPVPDPNFPFLGVHFTPRIDGSVWLGPNAVLAFAREGYKLLNINIVDLIDAIGYRGLRKLMFQYFTFGVGEYYRGIIISAQVRQLQRYIPSLKVQDVERGPAGVRAQAMDREGNLVDDFVFDGGTGDIGSRVLHVRNAPSPGATSSLAIAKMVVEKVQERFHL
ncbi:PREDICTED: L-2-hydroxyglutarate dehydrogenase, mitochondrial-like [Acropora digitifera]|uniref:L-2-hydroxyglutarate dehydrogenase, mitochondrial-like n=1 Tax=Acropora digitifera TaxID=70779 RepID=UPI00077A99CA|nr:PREDICTED: L-2-hydroxyglutarate dehydrogenase, mitochondrial-like [Acropora digitifera]